MKVQLHFIDLFAGLGGFHLALKELGHRCVFASEIDRDLADLYESNFRMRPAGDIRAVDISTIPQHDILCAGFPCQPFSKAGGQQGLNCPLWGDLIDYVVQILAVKKPRYFIMENVPNLLRHREGKTWKEIRRKLCDAGYGVDERVLSPHSFGVPQIRERMFMVGRYGGLSGFSWPGALVDRKLSIRSVLDDDPEEARVLAPRFIEYLEAWQQFLDRFPAAEELPSFPIWAMEFGATYPYENETPTAIGLDRMGRYRGSFGVSLEGVEDVVRALPGYARNGKMFPRWKIEFIRQNRDLYERHRNWIEEWLPTIEGFDPSFQKFEWNCKGEPRDIWRYVIQFRASGIRVKRATSAPSLVAMSTSQVPVVGWDRRYMTIRECSRLQSMGGLGRLPTKAGAAFRALGNAVNVSVVREVAKRLLAGEGVREGGGVLVGSGRSRGSRVPVWEGCLHSKGASGKREEGGGVETSESRWLEI